MRVRAARYAIAIALLAAAAALLAPATLVDALVAARTGGALRIADARGLWWNGHGILVATGAPARLPLGWRVKLLALARGALEATFATPDGVPFADVEATRTRLRLTQVDARIPAAVAVALAVPAGAIADTIAAGGMLSLASPRFEWMDGRGDGSLDARWQPARVAFAGIDLDLGDIELALRSQAGDSGLRGTLANRGGELALAGDVVVRGSTVSARLAVTPRVTTPEVVRSGLALLGRPDATGTVRIAWTSRL